MPLPIPPLCVADDATFWPWFSSPTLESWPDREHVVVVVPIAGMADWGLGHALDAEETVALHVLREASRTKPEDLSLLVLPPLRFVFGTDPGCAFAVDPPIVQGLMAEVVASVVSAGFERIVFYNSSPWNDEVCSAASRDLRLQHDIQVFRINLAGIGLDFHPTRSPDRRPLQTLLTALTNRAPEAPAASKTPSSAPWPDEAVRPLEGPALSIDQARVEGPQILAASAKRLLDLLMEIQGRPPLIHNFTS